MIEPAPAAALCPNHPQTPATWTCPRCGSFMCLHCECRTRPEATPMCPRCWELRARSVEPQRQSGTRLQTAGLVLGCISLLPLWFVQVVSLVVNIVAIVKASQPPAREVRWKPVLGLVLTVVGVLLMIGLIAFAASFG